MNKVSLLSFALVKFNFRTSNALIKTQSISERFQNNDLSNYSNIKLRGARENLPKQIYQVARRKKFFLSLGTSIRWMRARVANKTANWGDGAAPE